MDPEVKFLRALVAAFQTDNGACGAAWSTCPGGSGGAVGGDAVGCNAAAGDCAANGTTADDGELSAIGSRAARDSQGDGSDDGHDEGRSTSCDAPGRDGA